MHYDRQQLILDPGSYIMDTTGSYWSPTIRLRKATIRFDHQALDLGEPIFNNDGKQFDSRAVVRQGGGVLT